jgi:hypothetical protein
MQRVQLDPVRMAPMGITEEISVTLRDGLESTGRSACGWRAVRCRRIPSSSGARGARRGQCESPEGGGSFRLADYAALSSARSAADRARHCSRWTPSGTTSFIRVRCRK